VKSRGVLGKVGAFKNGTWRLSCLVFGKKRENE